MNFLRLTVVAILIFLAAGFATHAPERVSAEPGLEWQDCGHDLDCATVKVPLDYAKPDGTKIDLALRRQKALDPAKRVGVIVLNPGGPGGSGWKYMDYWSNDVADDIKDRFDIIGFDPRGVGRSTALVCHDTLLPFVAADPTPEDEAAWRRVEAVIKQFAVDCTRAAPDLLPHLGTLNVVRDIDSIRAALGEDKITYFGYSYGTAIGAYYADLFPNRVRAMVLDGALNPHLTLEQAGLQQAQGFEGALQRYAADCRRKSCELTRFGDPMEVIDKLMAQVEAASMPAPSSTRDLTAGEYVSALFGSLYSMGDWHTLTNALVEAYEENDGSALLDISDSYLGHKDDGTYDNGTEVYNAVTCLDTASVNDIEHYERLAPKAQAIAPHFGSPFSGAGIICSLWGARPQPLPKLKGSSTTPILVIGTTGDPATPYVWSQAMTSYLPSSRLLTYYGEGHTAYLGNDTCIDKEVNKYLMTVVLPAMNTACGDLARKAIIKIVDTP